MFAGAKGASIFGNRSADRVYLSRFGVDGEAFVVALSLEPFKITGVPKRKTKIGKKGINKVRLTVKAR